MKSMLLNKYEAYILSRASAVIFLNYTEIAKMGNFEEEKSTGPKVSADKETPLGKQRLYCSKHPFFVFLCESLL